MQTNSYDKVLVILFAIFFALMMLFALSWGDARGANLYEVSLPIVHSPAKQMICFPAIDGGCK